MGLAMSPWLDAVLAGWVDIVGGRQSARSIHFIVAWLLVAFVADPRVPGDRHRALEQPAVDDHRPLRVSTKARHEQAIPLAQATAAAHVPQARGRVGVGDRARRLRQPVAHRVVPEGARFGRAAQPGAGEARRPQGDGAGIRGVRPLADAFAATAPTIPTPTSTTRGSRASSPTTRSRSAGCARRRASSRSPSCARCRRARRSRGTIASRAGARSRSGRARACPRCSTS